MADLHEARRSTMRAATALSLAAVLIGALSAGGNTTAAQEKPGAPPGSSEAAAGLVRSLEDLDQARTFADLALFGLIAPGDRNHRAGTNLVLLTLNSTAVGKGDWFKALGLLGIEMLDVDGTTRAGYRSLFETGWGCKLREIQNPSPSNNAFRLLEGAASGPFEIPRHASLIARREAAMIGISIGMDRRFRFDAVGASARAYTPQPAHPSNATIRGAVEYGLAAFDDLASAGFRDELLRAALGAGAASLTLDGVKFDEGRVQRSIGQIPSYLDALKAALGRLAEVRQQDAGADFLSELCRGLTGRDLLPVADGFYVPLSSDAHQAMLAVVRRDLADRQRSDRP
jgi:hypothetical protein